MTRVLTAWMLGLSALTGASAAQSPGTGQGGSPWEGLRSLKLPETRITSAAIVPAGEFAPPARAGDRRGGPPGGERLAPGQDARSLAAFCHVAGVVAPQIHFEIWLPPQTGAGAWNGKFNGVGNGGLAGAINYGAMMQSLARGYATASTDAGHVAEPGNEAWPLGHPELLVDFDSRSIHMTARVAKAIVPAYYGRSAERSYFTGCSGGGGQALSEAQRYPADYDGIVAGNPSPFLKKRLPTLFVLSGCTLSGHGVLAGQSRVEWIIFQSLFIGENGLFPIPGCRMLIPALRILRGKTTREKK